MNQTDAAVSVLLVEDNPISLKVQTKMLEHKGFTVSYVDNGYDALNYVKNGRFSAIIMDLNMPMLSGYDTIRMIRDWECQQGGKNTPIIALTASAMLDKSTYQAKGIDYFIEKPLNDNEIMCILDLIETSTEYPN